MGLSGLAAGAWVYWHGSYGYFYGFWVVWRVNQGTLHMPRYVLHQWADEGHILLLPASPSRQVSSSLCDKAGHQFCDLSVLTTQMLELQMVITTTAGYGERCFYFEKEPFINLPRLLLNLMSSPFSPWIWCSPDSDRLKVMILLSLCREHPLMIYWQF